MARSAKQAPSDVAAKSGGLFLRRERLFARLDELAGTAVWLQGPTGSGKSVLLRTYSSRNALPTLWVPVDTTSGGADAFFDALVRAAEGAGVPDLPHFAGEHRKSPAELARLCAERISARQPGALLVIDDAHRLLPSFAPLLGALIDACCTDLRLLFAGQDLPLGLESHIATARLAVVGYEHLAFDESESLELARHLGATPEVAKAMHATTSGWAAGLMVALQLAQGVSAQVAQRRLESPLASLVQGGVLSGLDPGSVDTLAALSPARRIPSHLARAGTPWSDAVAVLERLSERGLFVDRQDNGDLRLHDLLCNALRSHIVDTSVRAAAVEVLSAQGRQELALPCLFAMPDPEDRLTPWLATHGETLLGRDDVGSLAARVLELEGRLSPPVLFWCARAAMTTDLALADATAERAYVAASEDASTGGALLRCCCGLGLLSEQVLLDAARIETWLARLADLKEATTEELEQAPLFEESARLAEHVLRRSRPNTEEIHRLHESLRRVLLTPQPPAEAVLAASLAVYSLQQLQRRQGIPALLVELESAPWFSRVPAHALIDWYVNKGILLNGLGRGEAAVECFDMGAALARAQGQTLLLRSALVGLARSHLTVGSLAAAESALREAEQLAPNPGLHRRVNELIVRAGLEVARSKALRAMSALDSAQALLDAADVRSSPTLERARMHVLYVLGRHAEALDLGQKCIEAREGAARDLTECDAALLRSLSGATEATAATKAFCDGIALVERHGWTNFLLLLPVEAGLIASRALRQDRAAAVFRDAIRERRLPAPSDQGTSWPWPLRVFLFSGMRLERFDEPMRFTGKVQRKPLELIKYLACARDQQADHASVCAALWPDAEESAARRSLEMATARLREMLGNPNWIRVTDNRTRLDPSFVWCDVQSVHRLCLEAERASRNPELARLRQIADDLLELYRGVLLDGEEDSPWVLGIRERVRTEFVRGVRALTAALQILGHDRADIDLLERALAAEPLAEELAQRLMMAQLQRRQPAEAMRVYRHLRQMLSVLLGSAPSIESDRLRDLILHQQQERSTT